MFFGGGVILSDMLQSNNLYPIEQLEPNGLVAVDLFCGAGIGAYGFKRAGYDIQFGIDNDSDAVRTYNLNIGNHAICEDIRKITVNDIPKCDLMIATPVCKPFSVCGARRLTDDEKYGDLLAEIIRLFKGCKPKALFFENVAGIAMGDSLPIFLDFVRKLENYGYHSYWSLVNSWDLGVPQERIRVYMVLIRDDTPYEFEVPRALLFGKKTQRDAFYDLRDKTIEDVKNHNTEKFKVWDTFSVNCRQTSWDMPAKTVLSHKDAVLCYPEPKLNGQKSNSDNFPRKLSVREELRLQTVGDDFYFPSDVSLNEQYNRCSGVPSLIAYKYGIAIANCLNGKAPIRQHTIKRKSLF
jgi:DNA (cytosine-5)-methyltransferase 1